MNTKKKTSYTCPHGCKDLYAQLDQNLSRGIWQVVGIFDADPPFAYSVGAPLIDPKLPEIIISGIRPSVGAMLINTLLLSILEGRETVRTDTPYTEVANMPCYLKKLNMAQIENHMLVAKNVHKDPFDAYQIVYPDRNGVFPWEEGYSFENQELLYRPIDN